ncbi:hypothetical protein NLJ89_g5782 [Agrocybe chaxingu]|uniref:Uncharacterized protein n=1 Tax=Agrocybe chaxingu TaxID=84603 RepID=A0A9W8JXV3_9AGAR|nr:hypothetical protein NLJ89_g5782 [Agrocybe chaxingu]
MGYYPILMYVAGYYRCLVDRTGSSIGKVFGEVNEMEAGGVRDAGSEDMLCMGIRLPPRIVGSLFGSDGGNGQRRRVARAEGAAVWIVFVGRLRDVTQEALGGQNLVDVIRPSRKIPLIVQETKRRKEAKQDANVEEGNARGPVKENENARPRYEPDSAQGEESEEAAAGLAQTEKQKNGDDLEASESKTGPPVGNNEKEKKEMGSPRAYKMPAGQPESPVGPVKGKADRRDKGTGKEVRADNWAPENKGKRNEAPEAGNKGKEGPSEAERKTTERGSWPKVGKEKDEVPQGAEKEEQKQLEAGRN